MYNTLRSYANTVENPEERAALAERIEADRAKGEELFDPVDTGIRAVDWYLSDKCKNAPYSGIRLNVHIIQSLSEFVKKGITPSDLDDIITNLVENAFKYAFYGAEGEAIEGKIINLMSIGNCIIVRDTGLPFSENIIENLGQFDNTTHGTGTGLPTVIRLAKKYGGTLTIEPDESAKCGKSVKVSFENLK